MEAGSYSLTISLPKETEITHSESTGAKEKHEVSKSTIQNIKALETNASEAERKTCLIAINNSVGGPIKVGWNFETGKPFDPAPKSTAKTGANPWVKEKIDVISDGHNPLNGTIVKSKSNITNN